MKLTLLTAVSALAIFATSCAKEKITPNTQTGSTPNSELQYTTDVVVFDPMGTHSVVYHVQSDNPGTLGTVRTELESSTLQLEYGGGGAIANTGVVPGSAAGTNNAVIVTAVDINIGTATSYSLQR